VKALPEGASAIPLGALTVANPLPTEFPRWTPQVLPAMMSGAGPSVRLEEIRFKREPVAGRGFAASRSNVECRFTIARSEASGWEPLQLELEDALGYRYADWRPASEWSRGEHSFTGRVRLGTGPMPGEPLRVTLKVTKRLRSPGRGDLATFRLHMPGGDRERNAPQRRRIAGGGAIWVSRLTRAAGNPAPRMPNQEVVGFRASINDASRTLGIRRAADNNGRALQFEQLRGSQGPSRNGTSYLKVRVPKSARWIDVTFLLEPVRKLQCVVPPPK
jgi:hypothetical protein